MNTSTASAQPICKWGAEGRVCQFIEAPRFPGFNGRHYCSLHAPLDTPGKWEGSHMRAFIIQKIKEGHHDFSGVVFSEFDGWYPFETADPITAPDCTFAPGAMLDLNCPADFSNSVANGAFTLMVRRDPSRVVWVKGQFQGSARLDIVGNIESRFSNSKFQGEVTIAYGGLPAALLYDNCTFSFPPRFVGLEKLPQLTSFVGANFQAVSAYGVGAEARYREIRNRYHANREREHEGLFYCYEKRALRRSLPLRDLRSWLSWRTWIARPVSVLYDITTRYGHSFERAFAWFVGLQLAAGFAYSWMSAGRLVVGEWSAPVAAFTMAQVLKPFEVFAARKPEGWAYSGVYPGQTGEGWWAAVTTLHSLLSISLVALFLLALRWRFRRD